MTLSPALRAALFAPFTPLRLNPVLWLDAQLSQRTLVNTSFAGTGTVTQVGTALTGVGTAFTGECKVGDALTGTLISGNVVSIASATALTLDASNSGAGAAFTITPTPGVSDRLSQVNDFSGRGNNVIQAARAKQAAYLMGASGINGLPCLEIDAIDDFLRVTFGASLSQPYMMYLGCSFGSTAAQRTAADGVISSARCAPYSGITDGNLAVYAGASIVSSVPASGVQFLSALVTTAGSLRRNGVGIASGNPGAHLLGGVTLGATFENTLPLGGKVFMLAVYAGAHSVAQQSQIENYYRQRGYW